MSLSLRSSQRNRHLAAAARRQSQRFSGGKKNHWISQLSLCTNESQSTCLRTLTASVAGGVRRSSEVCRKTPSQLAPAADFPLFSLSVCQGSPDRSFGETQKPLIFWCAKQENKTLYSYQREPDKLKPGTLSFWSFFFYVHKKSLVGFSTLAVMNPIRKSKLGLITTVNIVIIYFFLQLCDASFCAVSSEPPRRS